MAVGAPGEYPAGIPAKVQPVAEPCGRRRNSICNRKNVILKPWEAFPAFSYWLWTFKCRNNKSGEHGIFREVSEQTRPGASKHFSVSK